MIESSIRSLANSATTTNSDPSQISPSPSPSPVDSPKDLITSLSKWTWISGEGVWVSGIVSVPGILGTPSASNIPSTRKDGVTWSLPDGTIWIYGGYGIDRNNQYGDLDDLWRYSPSTNQWTWMGGTGVKEAYPVYGSKGVTAASNNPGRRIGAQGWTDPAGNYLWLFGGWIGAPANDLWRYTIATGMWTWVSGTNQGYDMGNFGTKLILSTANYPSSRYNAATSVDGSGQLWLFGGYNWYGFDVWVNDLWKYNPATNEWAWMGGGDGVTRSTTENQHGVYGTKGVGNQSNWPGSRSHLSAWNDSTGNFWILGGMGFDDGTTTSFVALDDVWYFNVSNYKWTWVSGTKMGNQAEVKGTPGTPAVSNSLGRRYSYELWKGSGNLVWIFGGSTDAFNGGDFSNDVWTFNSGTLEWTYYNGVLSTWDPGNFGTVGASSTAYHPSARMDSFSGQDASGNLYLMSGRGVDKDHNLATLNDVWRFTPANGEWSWRTGASTLPTYFGTYGTQGVASTSNAPPILDGANLVTDNNNRIWLFGGRHSYSYMGNQPNFNSLWMFDPVSNLWTWVSGSNSICGTATYGTLGVPSTSNTPASVFGSTTAKDKDGNFLFFGGANDLCNWGEGYNHLWKFNPTTKEWTLLSGASDGNIASGAYGVKGTPSSANHPGTRFHSRMVVDSQGMIWIFGGSGYDRLGTNGLLNDLWRFNPTTSQWTWMAGDNSVDHAGIYGTLNTPNSSNKPGSREAAGMWVDASDNIYIFGGYGYDVNATIAWQNDMFKFDGQNWTWISGDSLASGGAPVYGTYGNFAATNTPGKRDESTASFQGVKNRFWIYGGKGQTLVNNVSLGELWAYDVDTKMWACMKACDTSNVSPVYGTKGVENSTNMPGDRNYSAGAMDSLSNIWIYGGHNNHENDGNGMKADLWKLR